MAVDKPLGAALESQSAGYSLSKAEEAKDEPGWHNLVKISRSVIIASQ